MKNSNFQNQLITSLLQSCFAYHGNNTDFIRFNVGIIGKLKASITNHLYLFFKKFGFVRQHFEWNHVQQHLDDYIPRLTELEKVYDMLNDDRSQKLFIELLLFRILGNHHVKLMVNNNSYWGKYHKGDNNYLKKKHTSHTGRFYLNHYEIDGDSGPINLHVGSLTAFTMEQYAYRQKGKVISVEPGDIVIDGGSCWGDTTLYFADKIGAHGKVYAFEFVDNNVEVLLNNININQHLKDRIEVVQNALWNVSGETLEFSSNRGPSTWIGIVDPKNDTLQVSSISVDDLVREKKHIKSQLY